MSEFDSICPKARPENSKLHDIVLLHPRKGQKGVLVAKISVLAETVGQAIRGVRDILRDEDGSGPLLVVPASDFIQKEEVEEEVLQVA